MEPLQQALHSEGPPLCVSDMSHCVAADVVKFRDTRVRIGLARAFRVGLLARLALRIAVCLPPTKGLARVSIVKAGSADQRGDVRTLRL